MTRRHLLRLASAAAIGNLLGHPPTAAEARPVDVPQSHGPFPWIGLKFTARGEVMPCPGNTIICHIDPNGPAIAPLQAYRAALETQPFARKFAFTPTASYHMTVFEGVVNWVRKPGFWPADLALSAPLEACNRLFLDKLAAFDLGCDVPFRMTVASGPENHGGRPGKGIQLVPVDAQEEAKLRGLRDRLAERLQLRQPSHDAYRFHTTQTYAIEPLTEAETETYWAMRRAALARLVAEMPILELGAPEFCFFDDMFAFHPQLLLRRQPA